MALCPCQSNQPFDNCCAEVIDNPRAAKTAEQLMRSRYTAYALKKVRHLVDTHHPTTRSANEPADIVASMASCEWTGLEVLQCRDGGASDTVGRVLFNAHYLEDGKPGVLTEASNFVRDNGAWFYLNGVASEVRDGDQVQAHRSQRRSQNKRSSKNRAMAAR